MKFFDVEFSTIFGGMVGVEYVALKDDPFAEGLHGAIVVDLLFVRVTFVWGEDKE